MEADGVLARVSVDRAPARLHANGTPLTGSGVVIGDLDSAAEPPPPAVDEAAEDGCGCRVAGRSRFGATALALLFAATALRRRRRAR